MHNVRKLRIFDIVNNIVLNPQTLNIFVANNFDVPDAGTMYLFTRIYSQVY